MTLDEAADSIWDTEARFKFWKKKGGFGIEEDFGLWCYFRKNGNDEVFFLPENMTGDELYSLISQCEKEGSDKPLLAVVKDFPVPDPDDRRRA